jgi:hypothetical protein
MDGWMKDHDLSSPSPLEDEDVYMWGSLFGVWKIGV